MRRCFTSIVAAAVLSSLLTLPLAAQPATGQAAIQAVLDQVPASSVAVFIVPSLAASGAQIDQFIADVGLSQMLQGNVLQIAKSMLLIEQGLNEQGGLAVAVLDPEQFGWDVRQLIGQLAEGDDDIARSDNPPPLVMIVPTGDPQLAFANYQPSVEGGLVSFQVQGDTMYARSIGENVSLVAPSREAIALAQEGARIAMPDLHRQSLTGSAIAMYFNGEQARPLLDAIFSELERRAAEIGQRQRQGRGLEPQEMMLLQYQPALPVYRELMTALEAATVSLRFTGPGPIIEKVATFEPDSDWARIANEIEAPSGSPLSALPALPYVFAWGQINPQLGDSTLQEKVRTIQGNYFEHLFDGPMFQDVSPDVRQRLTEAGKTLTEQITAAQVYLGETSSQGPGVAGLSYVLRSRDAEATLGALESFLEVLPEFILATVPPEERAEMGELPQFRLQRNAARIAGQSVHVLNISHSALQNMRPEHASMFESLFGQRELRGYVATMDDGTVAIAMGGGEAFAAEAFAAASNGGDLLSATDAQPALRPLPDGRVAVGLFNPANLFELVKRGMAAAGGGPQAVPPMLQNIRFQTTTPISLGVGMIDNGFHARVFVPSGLVREIIANAMMVQSQMMQQQWQQGPSDDWDDEEWDDEDDDW